MTEGITRRSTRDDDIGGGSGGRDGAVIVEDVGAAGESRVAIGADGEVGFAIGVEIAGGESSTKKARCFTSDNDIGGGSGGRDGAVVVEDIGAAGIRRISISAGGKIGLAISIQITHGKGSSKVVSRGFTGDDDIGGGSGGGDGAVVVEDIGAAGIRRISISAGGKIGLAIGVEITGSEGISERVVCRFAGDDDIGGGSGGGDGAVVVEDVGTAGVGGIAGGSDGEVGLTIGIEIAGGERDTEVIIGRFTGDDDIGGGSGGGDGAVVVEDIGTAGVGGIAGGSDGEVGLTIGIEVARRHRGTEVVGRRFPDDALVGIHLSILRVEDIDTAGIGGIAIGSDDEVGFPVGIEISSNNRTFEIPPRFTSYDDIGGGSGGRDGAVIVEDVGAAGIGGITIGSDGEIGLPVGIEIAGGERVSEVITRRFTGDDNIGGGSGGGNRAVVVEDVGAAGTSGIGGGADREIGLPVGIEIAGGERNTEVIIGRFTGDGDIGGSSGGGDRAVVVEDVGAAGIGGVFRGPNDKVGRTISIEIAGGERDTKQIDGRLAGDNDIGGGSGGRDGTVVVEDVGAAGTSGIAPGTNHEVGFPVGIEIASGEGYTKGIIGRLAGDNDIGGGSGGGDRTVVVEDIGAAGIGGIAIGTDREISLPIGVEIASGEGVPEEITGRSTGDGDIGGSSGGGDRAVVVEDIRAAGIGGISFGPDDEIGFPVGIEITGGKGCAK